MWTIAEGDLGRSRGKRHRLANAALSRGRHRTPVTHRAQAIAVHVSLWYHVAGRNMLKTEVALSAIKEELYAVVAGMTDEEANRILEFARELRRADEEAALLDALKAIPGVSLPEQWPPHFRDVEPAVVSGRPASEMVVEDRR